MTEATHVDTANLDNFKEALDNFKEPQIAGVKIPYVVFGRWSFNWEFDPESGQHKLNNKYGLHVLKCHVGAPSLAKLQYYKNKGWQVLKHWFPHKSELPPKKNVTESGWVAALRGGDDTDLYSDARSWCRQMESNADAVSANKQEVSALKEELEKLKGMQNGNAKTTGSSKKAMDSKPSEKK